jgi:hypothetical protein
MFLIVLSTLVDLAISQYSHLDTNTVRRKGIAFMFRLLCFLKILKCSGFSHPHSAVRMTSQQNRIRGC